METKEVFLSPVPEDFAVGDRVYRHDTTSKEFIFGNIVRIRKHEFRVKIDDDSVIAAGQYVDVPFPPFKRNSMGKSDFVVQWAKALDLSQVETDSMLSFIDYETQTRKYVKVTHFPTNKTFILLTFMDSEGNVEGDELLADEHAESLESQLKDYVLEG